MIILDCDQNSDEWYEARLGIPTASSFGKILTPTGKISASRKPYLCKLVSEYFLKRSEEKFAGNASTERGHELEPKAIDFYEMENNVDVQRVGIVYKDEQKLTSCSPDGLPPNRGLEIKCKSGHVHMEYILSNDVPKEFKWQVHGSMWICDYDEWDFLPFHPELPSLILTIKRDEKIDKLIQETMTDFIDEMLEMRAKVDALIAA